MSPTSSHHLFKSQPPNFYLIYFCEIFCCNQAFSGKSKLTEKGWIYILFICVVLLHFRMLTPGFHLSRVRSGTALLQVFSVRRRPSTHIDCFRAQHGQTAEVARQLRFLGNYRITGFHGLWRPLICWLQAWLRTLWRFIYTVKWNMIWRQHRMFYSDN